MPKLLTVLTDLLFPPSPDALRVKHTTPKQIILCYEPADTIKSPVSLDTTTH
jgi:hypothetical protein